MSGRYAEGTSVQPETSQGEIAGLLRKYGADGFAYGWEADRAVVQFTAHGRRVRFQLTIPTDPRAYRLTDSGRTRDAKAQQAALEQEVRRLWRCLLLAIKAKLEVVASGIATFEEEFLAHIVLPDGSTVGDQVRPAIAASYDSGAMPPTLLALPPGGTP